MSYNREPESGQPDDWPTPPAGRYRATVDDVVVRESTHHAPPIPVIQVGFKLTGGLLGEWDGFKVWRMYPIAPSYPYTWLVFAKLAVDLVGWDAVLKAIPQEFAEQKLDELRAVARVLVKKPCEIDLRYATVHGHGGPTATRAEVHRVYPVTEPG